MLKICRDFCKFVWECEQLCRFYSVMERIFTIHRMLLLCMPLCRIRRSSDKMEISWLNCKQIENCYNFVVHSNFITVKPNLWSYQAKEHLLKFIWSRGSSKNFIIPAGCSLNWKKVCWISYSTKNFLKSAHALYSWLFNTPVMTVKIQQQL